MRDIGTIKIHCLSETLSPLTHMMGTAGNESIINRETVYHKGQLKHIPVLSGNAIRHRMLREPGAMYLVEQLGLNGNLTIDQANFLFNGGTLSESSISDNMKRVAELQTLFPLIRLMGGSLRNQIVSGSLIAKRGILVCDENSETINKSIPDDLKQNIILKSSENYISQYQYTRGDAEKNRKIKIKEILEERKDSNLMIYNGQTVITGSLFYHGFILQNVSKIELGALLHSLSLWSETNQTIGGSARIGHGILNTSIFIERDEFIKPDFDIKETIAEYKNHVEENKQACIMWLDEVFSERKAKK